jgi:hypothetical protein
MSKTLTTLLMLLCMSIITVAQSQNYKAFKAELLAGFAIPMGTAGGEKGGFASLLSLSTTSTTILLWVLKLRRRHWQVSAMQVRACYR